MSEENGEHGNGLPRQVQEVRDEIKALEAEKKGKTGGDESLSDQAPGQPQDPTLEKDQKPKPSVDDENLEQRFKVLQGKYNSEVIPLNARVRELTGENGALLQEIAFLKGQLQSQQEAGRPAAEDGVKTKVKSDIDPSSYEEYGEEIVDLAKRYRDQGASIAQLEAKMNGLEKTAEGVQENQREKAVAEFERELTKLCPEWKVQNDDRGFLVWIAQNGLNESLTAALGRLDFEKIANIFNLYPKPNTTPEPPPKPKVKVEEEKKPSDPLEEHVVPKTGGSDETPQSQPSFTTADVNAFYQSYSKGKYPFNACGHTVASRDEAVKLDNEITLAYSKGLVG